MIAMNQNSEQAYQQLFAAFFKRYPNPQLQKEVNRILKRFLALKIPMPGKSGGWAGGMVYSMSSIGVGVPGVLNSELEKSFNVSMGTIYKRAAMIRELLLTT
ncbi:MAG: hypothetical protein A2Y10_10330 [Planctomycetes bacterium GWF2_41_51]|nr:MAG: hypothetical protein A2Y10_10330 [Planctomycetes bacterium GWF2_41_51]HBG27662.1 hypothetical protein [Phycisphaerales bacterium]